MNTQADVSIIIPTYREVRNLPILVPRIAAALEGAGLEGEIVVADDNSRDGTVEVCADLADRHRLRLLVRENERDLSRAVIHGMQRSSGRFVVVMDADLSHPPETIPQLVAALRSGAPDFAIGSRAAPGGGTESGWGSTGG